MIKGAIEEIAKSTVSGWIYCEGTRLRDKTILAFSENKCVGSGKVSRFRQDLADAGLDDGYLGFSFPIDLRSDADLGSVIVCLEGSEAVLIQRDSKIGGTGAKSAASEPPLDDSLRRIRWLRRRGIVNSPEYDFLRGLARFGVYEASFDAKKIGADGQPEGIVGQAKFFLELTALNELVIKAEPLTSGEQLVAGLNEVANNNNIVKYVAVYSPSPTRLGVVEAAHLSQDEIIDAAGAVDYHLDASNFLIVNSNCLVVPRPKAFYQSLVLITAVVGGDSNDQQLHQAGEMPVPEIAALPSDEQASRPVKQIGGRR